ncbi:MAG: Hsp70 family protein [Candidatus Heimdallarchaeota archaeon]|nr:Hsp70 family protein [Candidatus Heimdallarchaeota archaeon]
MTKEEAIIYDFLPLTLSIETLGGIATPIVRRGTPLPAKRSQVLSTASDNQPSVEISISWGARPLSKYNLFIGKFLLSEIPPQPVGIPEVSLTFHIDKHCNVTVEASETKSNTHIEQKFDDKGLVLTDELIKKALKDAGINAVTDGANFAIAEAQLILNKENTKTSDYTAIDKLVSRLGLALMDQDQDSIIHLTGQLNSLITQQKSVAAFSGYGDIFESFFGRTTPVQKSKPIHNTSEAIKTSPIKHDSTKTSPTPLTPLTTVTPIVALIQSFLEGIDPELESKRAGAWRVLESNLPDSLSQASHSMREVLRQLLDKLAPVSQVELSPWYQKPKDGPPITRPMRIRYAIAGPSSIPSESTLAFINGMAEAIAAMYAKLSAETHSAKKPKISTTRMYLNSCEALIGLIATERIV